MIMRWKLTFPGKSPRGMARAFKDSIPSAMAEVGKTWVTEMLPQHFTENAQSVYKYKFRSKAYRARKLRKYGHNKMLVLTGELEKDILGSYRIIAKKSGVTVRMTPQTKTPITKQRAREITTILKREMEVLAKVSYLKFVDGVNKAKNDKMVTESMASAML